MQSKPIKKLYYSISDVSKIADIKQHVLRYWENEFSELHPTKNRAGNRIYRLKEIKIVFLIKRLLYDDKFTVEGAKIKLKELLCTDSELKNIKIDQNSSNLELSNLLNSMKDDLHELNNLIFSDDRGVAQSG